MNLIIPDNVCDSHAHIGDRIPSLEIRFTINNLISILDEFKIDYCMVSSIVRIGALDDSKLLIKVAKKDKRIIPLMRQNPTLINNEYYRFLDKSIAEYEAYGVKINGSIDLVPVTSPIYRNVLEILHDRESVLLLHCGRWRKMSDWSYGIKVARKYPKIKVIMAHMGGTHPDYSFKAIDAAHGIPNIYFNTSQCRQLEVIKRGLGIIGDKRILFGSDMPWGDYVQNLVGMTRLGVNDSSLRNILEFNFKDLLGLDR